jgi:hypothetical protein
VIPFLSDEWIALYLKEAAAEQPVDGPTIAFEITLTRDEAEARTFTSYFVDGALASISGPDPDADVHFEVPEAVYMDYCEGGREALERAMLKGQMRITGERDKLMVMEPVLWSEAALAVRGRVHEQTLY